MPTSEKQRRAAFAALEALKKGKKPRAFEGMSAEELSKYAHSHIHKLKKRGAR
jgi:hypothetical protein